MAPLTLDFDQHMSTNVDSGDYDRWERTEYYAPDFERTVSQELDRLGQLEPNWDAEGAAPIDPAVLDAARTFLSRLPENIASTPAVVPMRKGNLQFEWNAGPRSLELEIEDLKTIHYLKWDSEQGIEEEDFFPVDDTERAETLIRWFMGSVVHV
ncbi:MAG: hypothetical protein RBS80_22660 [Thermoguttaceae bacterium]|jgi:hypothetical protein|nr:hypothetical protein [Thermoguttaceae bacterium]